MTSSHDQSYQQLSQHARTTALLASIESLLGWDERTLLPTAAGEYRAEQMTYLAGMLHQRHTDPRLDQWLTELADSELAADPLSDAAVTVRQLRRDYEKKVKLPQSLVEELTRATVRGQQMWVEARRNNDFASFRPILEQIIELKRQQADAQGYDECRYDALLDDYEPGETTANVARVLGGLREELIPLVGAIRDCDRRPNVELLRRRYPVDRQQSFGRQAAEQIGFDFSRGRLDVTAHPFCSELGPHDCRITTRYDERFFPSAFFGTLHEAGHGIYEQGLLPEHYGLPLGRYVSMGIHESQSRMWENLVGRSRPFWEHFYPAAQQMFPEALSDVSLDAFHFAINDVRPSLIRVEADEATYNLHIIIRFELEQALLAGDLAVADLPAAWNEKYRQYLGIEPTTDSDGVLQDIHWSAGLFGYFPTYSLGNLYAAQFFAKADADLGGLSAQFAAGEFGTLRQWLREKIHHQGQRWTAAQLIEQVTNAPLGHAELINYLLAKLEPLYSGDSQPVSNAQPAGDAPVDQAAMNSSGSDSPAEGAATGTSDSAVSLHIAAGALSDDAPAASEADGGSAVPLGSIESSMSGSSLEAGAASVLSESSVALDRAARQDHLSPDSREHESAIALAEPETASDSMPSGIRAMAQALAPREEAQSDSEFDGASLRTEPRAETYEIGMLGNVIGVVVFGFVGLVIGYLLLVGLGGSQYNFLNLSLPW